jgi:hypothetical protein
MKRLDINKVLSEPEEDNFQTVHNKRHNSIKPKMGECANGKLTYDTMGEASIMADVMRKKRHRGLAPYKCNLCGKYHLGRRGR